MVDTVLTKKFSDFVDAGDLANDEMTVGVNGGTNAQYNNPWTFLAPGSTGDRPVPAASMYYRLRLNTTLMVYEYYDPISTTWAELSGSGTGTVNPGSANDIAFYASAGQALSPLSTLAKAVLVTNVTGVPSLSTTLPTGLSIPGAIITASTAALSSGSVVAAPAAGIDLTNKTYVDNLVAGAVTSITGTANQIIASSPTGAVTLSLPQDIATGSTPTFFSLTLTSPLTPPNGGTGINNGASTITLGGSLTTSGAFATTFTMTGATNVTFPTSGTLATVGGTVSSITGTANQVLANGTSGSAQTGAVTLTLPQSIATSSSPTFNNLTLTGGLIKDTNGNNAFGMTAMASAVNYLTTTSSTIGTPVSVLPAGTDTNIQLNVYAKGTSAVAFLSTGTTAQQFMYTGAGYQHTTQFNYPSTAASQVITWPDATGTVALTSQLVTPAALSKTDDLNVTLTLGGSPSTALVNGASLTLGWTGQLGLTRGGTAASLTASNGGIVYSTASALAILAGTATARQMLQSGASAAPAWSTSTYPATNAINTLLYASSANVMTALATANNGILVTSAGGVPSIGNTVGAGLTMPSITFNSTSGIIGTTTNDSAATGSVGEYLTTSSNALATSVTANTATDILLLSLTAGDWDVWGTVTYFGNASTVAVLSDAWVSATSATRPASEFRQSIIWGAAFTPYATGPISLNAPMTRISLASTSNVYLEAYASFTTSTTTAGGALYARRRR